MARQFKVTSTALTPNPLTLLGAELVPPFADVDLAPFGLGRFAACEDDPDIAAAITAGYIIPIVTGSSPVQTSGDHTVVVGPGYQYADIPTAITAMTTDVGGGKNEMGWDLPDGSPFKLITILYRGPTIVFWPAGATVAPPGIYLKAEKQTAFLLTPSLPPAPTVYGAVVKAGGIVEGFDFVPIVGPPWSGAPVLFDLAVNSVDSLTAIYRPGVLGSEHNFAFPPDPYHLYEIRGGNAGGGLNSVVFSGVHNRNNLDSFGTKILLGNTFSGDLVLFNSQFDEIANEAGGAPAQSIQASNATCKVLDLDQNIVSGKTLWRGGYVGSATYGAYANGDRTFNAPVGTITDASTAGTLTRATIANTIAVPFGTEISALGAGADSERFGLTALAAGSKSVAVGKSANAGGTESVALGRSASSGGASSVAVGYATAASQIGATAVGRAASASAANATALGSGAIASGAGSVALGVNASTAGFANSLAIGNGAVATGANKGEIGTAAEPIDLTIHGIIAYTPTVPGDWVAPDPDDVYEALDVLAARTGVIEIQRSFGTVPTGTLDLVGSVVERLAAQVINAANPRNITSANYHNIALNVSVVTTAGDFTFTGTSYDPATGSSTPADTEIVNVTATGWWKTTKHWLGTVVASATTADITAAASVFDAYDHGALGSYDLALFAARWEAINAANDMQFVIERYNFTTHTLTTVLSFYDAGVTINTKAAYEREFTGVGFDFGAGDELVIRAVQTFCANLICKALVAPA